MRDTLRAQVDLRAHGPKFVEGKEPDRSREYREHMNSKGSPSETVSAGYRWQAGTELAAGRAA